MKLIAIIPARGGSKRIERKNVKEFAGKPVIAYSIEAAIASGCFSEVMVSTDDEEIAAVAREYGATVPFMRSAKTADDYATTADVINEVLDRYAELGKSFDGLACIYATAPFITAGRLRRAARILENREAEAAFTCVEYSYPIQRSLAISPDGRIGMKFPEFATARSQDLPKSYHDAGQFYFTTVSAFCKYGSLWGPDTLPIILPEIEVQDLDTLRDWELAELKYRMLLPRQFRAEGYTFTSYTELDEATSEAMRIGRNEPEVCRQSVNTKPISAADHARFVDNLSDRNDVRYYAVTDESGEIVGSVNLHSEGLSRAERGIWIAADKRGKGLSHKVLSALYRYLAANTPLRTITTRVRLGNEPSHRLERSLGASETGRDHEYVYYELTLRP